MSKDKRDEFREATKKHLGRSVGFKCSLPDCGVSTVGPHTSEGKSVSIGVAAHITAAAKDGPRYEKELSEDQRRSAENGIWICHNCSDKIDKDEIKYKVKELKEFKKAARERAAAELGRHQLEVPQSKKPIIELERFLITRGKSPVRQLIHETRNRLGRNVFNQPGEVVYRNKLHWKFGLEVYNQSSFPAFNISFHPKDGDEFFTGPPNLKKIKNLAPLGKDEVRVEYVKYFTGTGPEALELVKGVSLPPELIGEKFFVSFNDENGVQYSMDVTFTENGFDYGPIKEEPKVQTG